MDEHAFAWHMGSAFENLREQWPVMELQPNEWIQEHFALHQKWLESLKKDLVNEVNAFEQKVATAMHVLEQKFLRISQQAFGSTESSADLLNLQHLVQRLTDQVTLLESQSIDLKFSVNTNLKAQGTKLGFCVDEIKNIEDHVLELEKKNAETVVFQAERNGRNLEIRHYVSELRYQAPLDNADMAAQVAFF